jgi:hypothetical protein
MYSPTFDGQGGEQGRNSVPSLEENGPTLRDTPGSPLTIEVDFNPHGPTFPLWYSPVEQVQEGRINARSSAAQCRSQTSHNSMIARRVPQTSRRSIGSKSGTCSLCALQTGLESTYHAPPVRKLENEMVCALRVRECRVPTAYGLRDPGLPLPVEYTISFHH